MIAKEWFLDFPFEEKVKLIDVPVTEQIALAVDLGINSAATVSVMRSDGTIQGRHFCKLPREYDCLKHAINRIKKAQQHGNRRMPRLWAVAKGINDDIAVKTAQFIMDVAALYNAVALEVKIPSVAKRSTCTLSTLISLNAELLSA